MAPRTVGNKTTVNAKHQVWDIKSMSAEELRALIARCNAEEESARYKKGRRSWTQLRSAAQGELVRRGVE